MDYVCGTVHPQAFSRIFGPARFAPSEADHPKVLETGKANAVKYFDTLEKGWKGGDWAVPGGYSIADAALFFVEYWWAKRVGETLPPKLAAHLERMLARPAVKRALEAE
ncbi:glutathione binding-like protein, partial [Roseomonas sp. DSM 102946]|nr:glutathione binding-like protein [Roseomonas sp. DSM 102946]